MGQHGVGIGLVSPESAGTFVLSPAAQATMGYERPRPAAVANASRDKVADRLPMHVVCIWRLSRSADAVLSAFDRVQRLVDQAESIPCLSRRQERLAALGACAGNDLAKLATVSLRSLSTVVICLRQAARCCTRRSEGVRTKWLPQARY